MWGEAQGPPECHGESCPHYLGPEDAAHALAEHGELRRARRKLAALPKGLETVLEAVVDLEGVLPEPWEAIVRTWHWSPGGIRYSVGLRRSDDELGVLFDLERCTTVSLTGPSVDGWSIMGRPGGFDTIADAVQHLRDDDRL